MKKILWNKFTFLALTFLLMQQLIVASSTFWISYLSEAVVLGKNVTFYLVLFVSSLFLVYIPGVFASFYLEKAKSKAIHRYTQQFSESYKCLPTMLSEKEFQAEREPWLTNEGSRTIEETYHMLYDSTATGLNTILNIGALCIAIDSRMISGYFLSFMILPIVSKYLKHRLADVGLSLQNDRKSLSQTLLSGWDNIVIGNIYNFTIWWKQYCARWGAYNNSSAKNALFNQLASAAVMMCALVPVAGTFIWLFLHTSDTAKLAALIATLPRQIQIIQHFEILSTYAMYWHGTYAKIKALMEALIFKKEDHYKAINDRISIKEMKFTINNSVKTFENHKNLFEALSNRNNGRITIQGRNGSGKTTLVNMIKNELGEQAYYLPTNSRLLFDSILNSSLSTGQRVKACLDELEKSLTNLKVLILDEWDANLDNTNIEVISSMLDKLANKYCIIEISHRQL